MGLWSWLFPSESERIEQARALIAKGKFADARHRVLGILGDEAEKLYELATKQMNAANQLAAPAPKKKTDEPLMVLSGNCDMHINVGNGEMVQINAPPPATENDPPFSNEPLIVARAVLDHYRDLPLSPRGEYTFVEAAWLLTSCGQLLGGFADGARMELATMVRAIVAGDAKAALATLQTRELARYATPIIGARFTDELIDHCLTRRDGAPVELPLLPSLVLSLAPRDPQRCLDLIALCDDASVRATLTLEAHLAATENSLFSNAWAQAKSALAADALATAEIRIASRTDLSRAEVLWLDSAKDTEATEAFFTRLAAVDPDYALSIAAPGREGSEDLPCVLACHASGVDIASTLDKYIESLSARSYRPIMHFSWLVFGALRLGDADRFRRICERGGPAGWQIALTARFGVDSLAREHSPKLSSVYAVCEADYTPGFIAGRDASAGLLHAGQVAYRNAWLAFSRPRPVETLRVIAALAAANDGPQWFIERLP